MVSAQESPFSSPPTSVRASPGRHLAQPAEPSQCYQLACHSPRAPRGLPMRSKNARGQQGSYPIKLFYTSNMPIILQSAQLLYRKFSGNFFVNLLGQWKESEYSGQSIPVSGLAYLITTPARGNVSNWTRVGVWRRWFLFVDDSNSLSLSLSSFPPRRSLSISLAISLPISPRPNQKMISSRRDESAPLDDSFSLAILVACASISQSSTPPPLWLSSTESVRAALDDYSSLWLSSTPPRLALDRRRLRRPSLAVDASASRSRSSNRKVNRNQT
ncbi:hypothetical protein Bca4012_000460 [Brassica carinata]